MNWVYMALAITTLMISHALADGYNTTKDGNFQAIAQGSDQINVYWRHGGAAGDIYVNGKLTRSVSPDTSKPFNCLTLDGLEPNTEYRFTLGVNGPGISERTSAALPETRRFDLIVIGGTASGMAAALSAASLGLNVALVEETNRIGGMSVNGLGSTDIRLQSRANGIFEDFRRGVVEFYGSGDGLRYESRVALAVVKKLVCEQPGITQFLKCRAVEPLTRMIRVIPTRGRNLPVDAEIPPSGRNDSVQDNFDSPELLGLKKSRVVEGAVVADLTTGQTGMLWADTVIDATDTADFAAACGCEVRIGREPRSDLEPHAGHIFFRNSDQTILPGSSGAGDDKLQSYAYLMTWKDFGDGKAPLIPRPQSYDPETYRYSPAWQDTWNASSGRLPNRHFEINQHPFGIDLPGINYDYPTASRERRGEIESMLKDRALGYLYYIQNELGKSNLGLADDEFLDNDNFPVSLYVREARRVVGEHLFTESDVTNARDSVRSDSILIGDYPMDSHAMEELRDPTREDKGEGECWLRDFTPWYQVPYGVIVPGSVENLLVTTAVSATHIGYGTLRMEPVRIGLGQAAGAAAYWRKLTGEPLRQLDVRLLQDKLLSAHVYTTWFDDVNRETRHFKAIQYLGTHGFFNCESFRPDEPLTGSEATEMLDRLVSVESDGRLRPTFELADPANPITRGQFAELLVRAKRMTSTAWEPTVLTSQPYSDVAVDSPHANAIAVLKSHLITPDLFALTTDGEFGPDEPISRADAVEAIFLAHREQAFKPFNHAVAK